MPRSLVADETVSQNAAGSWADPPLLVACNAAFWLILRITSEAALSISDTRLLTQTEINDAFCNADFEIGNKPQNIILDTGANVTVVFEGVEFGDDAQVKLYDGELAGEEK